MSRQDARNLAALFADVRVKIDLIDVNDPSGEFRPPTDEEVHEFRDELAGHRIPVSRRYAGGRDIDAACGTLAATRRGGVATW
jgi:23S rRNA (adenine2503-C2)-methyltransferase